MEELRNLIPQESYFENSMSDRIKQAFQYAPVIDSRVLRTQERDWNLEGTMAINSSVSEEQLFTLVQNRLRGSVICRNLAELREAFALLNNIGNEKYVRDTIAHENAHANVAEKFPEKVRVVGYGLTLLKDFDGSFGGVSPFVFWVPIEGSDRTVEKYLRDIIITKAPEIYGEALSDSDEFTIEQRRKYIEEYIDRCHKGTIISLAHLKQHLIKANPHIDWNDESVKEVYDRLMQDPVYNGTLIQEKLDAAMRGELPKSD